MLTFDKSFFHDEVRDGFYVDSMMKRCWAAGMTVLDEIVGICLRHDIRIFADYGTLLGAVRHGGFIPWDDDIDVLIMREDFERFKSAVTEEMPKGWRFLESTSIKDHFFEPWCRITNKMTFLSLDEELETFHGFRYPSGLDVFVMDYMAGSDEEVDVLVVLYDLVRQCCFVKDITDEEFEERLSGIEQLLNVKVTRGDRDDMKTAIMKMVQAVISSYGPADSDVMVKMTSIPYAKLRYSPEYFKEMVFLPFETIKIPAPVMYDRVLSTEYRDYMKKVRGKSNHGYPSYKKNKDIFEEKLEIDSAYRPGLDAVLANGRRQEPEKKGKVIFFLPYNASTWNYLHPAWEKAMSNEENIVFVMPIPYFEKHYSGRLEEQVYETKGYPEEVEITRLSEINIEAYDIDEIYIQCPFDERNTAMSVHPYFYAPHLRSMCSQLIYIQDFDLAEIESADDVLVKTFESFLAMPGLVYSDQVIVQSENMKKHYVDYLCEWMGEKTRDIWNDKLTVRSFFPPSQSPS